MYAAGIMHDEHEMSTRKFLKGDLVRWDDAENEGRGATVHQWQNFLAAVMSKTFIGYR